MSPAPPDLLDRKLLFVTGKGGVGKTTVAAALGTLAASHGKRTLVCEVDAKGNLAEFFEADPTCFEPRELEPGLFAMSMNTEASLREYLKIQLRIPLIARIGPLARSFDFVAQAAPGVREILTVGKFCWEVREEHYDLVIVDASATGHIVGQLAAPQAINELVKVGMVRDQTAWMVDILSDAATTGAVIVAAPEEMPVNETLELAERLGEETTVDLAAVIVNRVLPELFGRGEEEIFGRLREPELVSALGERVGSAAGSVLDAAQLAVTLRRSRAEHLTRLREGLPPAIDLLYLPYLFTREHGVRATRQLAEALGAELGVLIVAEPDRAKSLEQLLAAKEIVLSCGSGGVGKTTTAAAAGAMAAAHLGGTVLVLTVDPARRLANALGLERFGNVETRIPDAAWEAAGVQPRGELWAAMLDTKQSWDDLVQDHAPDEATRDAILANPLYQNITGKFIQSHDYIAMERLYQIHSSGRYDLIVVDTPPTRNAIDFLEAPERMADFFSSRLLRWLIMPYRSRLYNAVSKPFYDIADRILGSQFLQDIAEFFILFQTMYDGFVERARAVTRTLEDKRTTFVVVSTLESAPAREAEFFVQALSDRDFNLGAVVLNKVLPSYLLDDAAAEVATHLCADAEKLARELPSDLGDPDDVARVLTEVGESFLNYRVVAQREAEQAAELSQVPELVVTVPYFDHDITDLAGLLELGSTIWR